MKYGQYLASNLSPEWAPHYLDYSALKELIKRAEQEDADVPLGSSPREASLTVSRKTGMPQARANAEFSVRLRAEMDKVSEFTQSVVSKLRSELKSLEKQVDNKLLSPAQKEQLEDRARELGNEFLKTEKFVNLNYLGFHKILKKHDKMLPHSACAYYFISHLHQQPWVQGNYSDIIVQLSSVYSKLRGDSSGVRNDDSAQGFVRSTTKYWVKTKDVSFVKHAILQELPVFLFNQGDGGPVEDCQLVNSVYLDNTSAELYHGRLDKRPNALAVRLRWYGTGAPTTVFVERKTHRESWKGEESVKERFVLPEEKVVPFLEGTYTVEQAVEEQLKGKSAEEIAKFRTLFTEIQQVVDSKQLKPMIRTQYMRTAFQIPFDATVRISLDINLLMIKENPDDGPTCSLGHRWYRDPTLPIKHTEITKFPHAVLEVKLSLNEGQSRPEWVDELLCSGTCTEVHKFSKFIHGTATLLPENVQAVPYWFDDESVKHSINASAAPTPQDLPYTKPSKPRRIPQDDARHPLLGTEPTLQLTSQPPPRHEDSQPSGPNWFDRLFRLNLPRGATVQRLEPKTFFASERTFLSWLHMAVTIGSIAAALLGFAATADRGSNAGASVEVICMILLPLAVVICFYALYVFLWRSHEIAMARTSHIHDSNGPLILAGLVVAALSAILIIAVDTLVVTMREQGQGLTFLLQSFEMSQMLPPSRL